jgi:hypothetical protein
MVALFQQGGVLYEMPTDANSALDFANEMCVVLKRWSRIGQRRHCTDIEVVSTIGVVR